MAWDDLEVLLSGLYVPGCTGSCQADTLLSKAGRANIKEVLSQVHSTGKRAISRQLGVQQPLHQ